MGCGTQIASGGGGSFTGECHGGILERYPLDCPGAMFGALLRELGLIFHGEISTGNVRWLSRVHVRIPVQDYKSLHAAVIICATLVNTQTHTHRQTAFDQSGYGAQPAELKYC